MRKTVIAVALALSAVFASAAPAQAAWLEEGWYQGAGGQTSAECATYTIEAFQPLKFKTCVGVNVNSTNVNGNYWRAEARFCQQNPSWPCDANRMRVIEIELHVDACNDGQGWLVETAAIDYEFDPRQYSHTASPSWGGIELIAYRGRWWRAQLKFQVRDKLYNDWSSVKTITTNPIYKYGNLLPAGTYECPNLH